MSEITYRVSVAVDRTCVVYTEDLPKSDQRRFVRNKAGNVKRFRSAKAGQACADKINDKLAALAKAGAAGGEG